MTRGERVIAFIERYCIVPEGKLIGQPMKLDTFQIEFLLAIYDNPQGTDKAYLSIARKNGKTGLIAGILLAHLVGPEAEQNSQIVSGAMSREQASIVFELAVKMIGLNPALQEITHVIPSSKQIIGIVCNVRYKALAAEGKTSHGLSPILAILDEVGQIVGPQDAFIDAIVTAQGAHEDPLLIAISTQASNDADLFSIWLDDAKNSKDPHIVSHVYEAHKDADISDPKTWKSANPALGTFRSLKDMKRLAEMAARMPSSENTFRNLNLNQRVSTVSPFISRSVWESCGAKPQPITGVCYAGLDMSESKDLTALVIIGQSDDGIWNVHPYFWTPKQTLLDRAKKDRVPYDVWVKQGWLRTTPGSFVDYDFVVKDIAQIISDFDISAIAFDRWRIEILKKAADLIGLTLPLVQFGQGFKDMAPALDTLEAALLNGKMRHGMHPVLTMCAGNAVVVKDAASNRKIDKSKATGRMDGMVALAMATGAAGGDVAEDNGDIDDFLNRPLSM
ncbi:MULTISPECIES: terminase large subunit [Yersinia pseudotuberculosis complex]|uniref:Terminase n=1 Tax=Yersinia similis TaxID=367190 RepID=A0ABM5PZN1_9GAMM|nr:MULTISPECIES: terminase TerL endonuclease subunit [Yersinia pseudotuberculosis complex]AHK20365.1 terminase [Yersinia similis]CFQ72236.1 Phage terminase-like protein%2C large subunit [Yersinia similis]CNI97732.1 Phage terminase-like protein%2C large subunit [Yersinia pseudotuberculosis]CNK99751.1 Phage terminase-like protein%2C large subunit [Yersinia pseudotuberculosis]BET62249.1 terminase large subunit [Yersinia pseudotuberculosis]